MFKRWRDYAREIDWTAIVGSALLLVFCLVAVVPALNYVYQPEKNAANYYDNPEHLNVARTEGPDDRIATYTLWLTGFTGLLVLVSAWQGYLILRAEEKAKSSLAIAGMQAQAAMEQARAAHISADRLLKIERPYLILTGHDVEDIPNVTEIRKNPAAMKQGYALKFKANVMNIGTRTAFLRGITIAEQKLGKLPPSPPKIVSIPYYPPNYSIIAPGVTFEMPFPHHMFPLTGAEVIEIADNGDGPFIYGYISYSDVHQTKRRTGFAYKIIFAGQGLLGLGLVIPCPPDTYWYDTEEDGDGEAQGAQASPVPGVM